MSSSNAAVEDRTKHIFKDLDLEKYGKKVGDSKDFVCTICPNSCRLHIEVRSPNELVVSGFTCPKGMEFGKQEFLEPKRMLITTMKIKNGVLPVIPVRSNKPIPKEMIFKAMEEVNNTEVKAPVKMGDVLIKNLFNLNVDVVASRDMEEKKA
ncbi:MAG: DUF1667 domain-containing protein [Promethearchaeota archaeon]